MSKPIAKIAITLESETLVGLAERLETALMQIRSGTSPANVTTKAAPAAKPAAKKAAKPEPEEEDAEEVDYGTDEEEETEEAEAEEDAEEETDEMDQDDFLKRISVFVKKNPEKNKIKIKATNKTFKVGSIHEVKPSQFSKFLSAIGA